MQHPCEIAFMQLLLEYHKNQTDAFFLFICSREFSKLMFRFNNETNMGSNIVSYGK